MTTGKINRELGRVAQAERFKELFPKLVRQMAKDSKLLDPKQRQGEGLAKLEDPQVAGRL